VQIHFETVRELHSHMKCLLGVSGTKFGMVSACVDDQPDGEPDGEDEGRCDPQVVDHEWFGVLGRLLRNTWTVRVVVAVIP
jgi:hypothetical protein